MLTVRPAEERGAANHGWLDTRHSFSFADYYDPAHMGYRALRVINEDVVAPGAGFDTHGHRDMEIVTYVLEGSLEHKDSIGTGSVIRPGEVQRMTAGTGIRHSEYNHSKTEPVHLLQIWILPERRGLAPGYEQRGIPPERLAGRLAPVATRDGRDGSVTIHQDATILVTVLAEGESVRHALAPGRHAWVQVARGALELNGRTLKAGDGCAVADEAELVLACPSGGAEALVFDLA